MAGSGHLGGLVGEFRRRAGLTQQELADVAGLSVAGVRDLEQGRVVRPRAGTMRRLVSVLGLSRVEAEEFLRIGATGRAAGAGVRVGVLGPLRILVGGAEVDPGSETQRLLLGMLALSPNVPVGRDALIEIAWGAHPPPTAVELLQSRMSRLRRRLQHPKGTGTAVQLVATAGGGYQLTVHDEHLDLLAFRRQVSRARQALAAGEAAGACEYFARAVALWRGQPLSGIGVLETHPVVVALVREWQVVVVEYATVAAELGRHEDVLPALRQVVESDPLNELAHARLMVALAGSGQQAAALTTFEDMRRRLAEDLGTDPGPELTEAFQRVLHQDVARSEAAPVSAHQQLPPDVADFSGRAEELRQLNEYLASVTDEHTAVPILSIEGMPGAGKTRIAVRLAHRLLAEGQYGDVQLYVDLCGHSDQPPADPSAVLASFLRLLGVPGGQVPHDLPSRAALYRDRLHGKRALVLLDNAAGDAQIRPLLPASPTNLVLITSRRTLAVDGGHTLPLDVFTPEDGTELLSRVIGAERVAGDPDGAQRIVDLCGRLPLAIALAARRLQARPSWRLADLVHRLEGARDRLDELAAGSRQLRAVFDLSYRALDADARWLFRLTGLHPGPDFTAESVAALAGREPAESGRILDRLVDERLVTMVTGDRYRLHDLLADYARHVSETDEPEPDRRAALTRLLDYYLHVTSRATELLRPGCWRVDLTGTPPAHFPPLDTREDAEAWLHAERANLLAALGRAAGDGWPAYAWRLAHAVHEYLALYGFIDSWVQTHEAALRTAVAAGDRRGEAVMLTFLAAGYVHQQRYEDARAHFHWALDLSRDIGDRSLESSALSGLGFICYRLGQFSEALEHAERELALEFEKEEESYRRGVMLNNVGVVRTVFGRFDEAMANLRRAMSYTADHVNECSVLSNIGVIHRERGEYAEAAEYFQRALALAADYNARPSAVLPLARLAATYRMQGRVDEALPLVTEALDIVGTMGGPECEVLTELGAVHRAAGRLAEAEQVLRRVAALAVGRQERYRHARALDELAIVHWLQGRTERARAEWHQAHTLFTEMKVPDADRVAARLEEMTA